MAGPANSSLLPDEEVRFDTNPIGIAECLVNDDRETVSWGFGHVDDVTAISKSLVRQIQPKVMPLEIHLEREDQNSAMPVKIGYGQGGFIRHEPIQDSLGKSTVTNYSVQPITAKHNLRRVQDPKTCLWYRPVAAVFRVPRSLLRLHLRDLGWTPSAADRYDLRGDVEARAAPTYNGFDISAGDLVKNLEHPGTRAHSSFAKVGHKFRPKTGMKVGMAVMFPKDARPTRKTIAGAFEEEVDEGEAEIKNIYGDHSQVNIYLGEILYVGRAHIEYNINSFTGCAGAIVFLSDMKQPDSVDVSDYGKALAIHSGSHPVHGDRNFGFLINSLGP
jgi:hypothetical protein